MSTEEGTGWDFKKDLKEIFEKGKLGAFAGVRGF